MSVDWNKPVQMVSGAPARLFGVYNFPFGKSYAVVELCSDGFDIIDREYEVNEDGFSPSGIRKVENVPPAKVRVTRKVYAVYNYHGDYIESFPSLEYVQKLSGLYKGSTVVEMSGEIEIDSPVESNEITCHLYAAVDRDGDVLSFGKSKDEIEEIISSSNTPLVLVEFNKTFEWIRNA